MILKLVGQLVIATVFTQLIPADASYFEWQAGVAGEPIDFFETETLSAYGVSLPVAGDRHPEDYPIKVDSDSYGIVTTAQSALVVDAESGMILLGKHPYQVRSIGSVTKLMSALVFLEADPDMNQIVTLDPTLDLIEGGRVYLAFYDGIELEDVLAASLVGSDNTATEALMRFSGLTREEFIARMNSKAEELGMKNSTFTDPTGIDSTNMSTAWDLVKLLRAAEDVATIQKFMTTSVITVQHLSGRSVTIENTNLLLESFLNTGEFDIAGGKTGYLPQAGYVLVSSIEKGSDKIYVIVMGSESKDTRVQEAKGLASWAFKVYKWPGE
ncbi:MAG: serine hydrolase [Candidatus Uhrbacteria bacterium]|nr:serine hydrolase [Candidatus Uhrbacteria bacterium]